MKCYFLLVEFVANGQAFLLSIAVEGREGREYLNTCCEMLIYFFFKLKFVTELFYVSMPNICAALNCRTGYKNEPVNADVALHKFPLNNPTLLNLWTRRIS